jgi:ribosomal peptide maturation radical SAM protein 1
MGEQTFRVVLVNMPFASLSLPSLALTQLASVLRARFGARVAVETLYLNLDFARFFGDTRYYSHVVADAGFLTGVGDWFFRQCAFPAAEDNTGAYLRRFYFGDDAETRTLRGILVEKRKAAAAFLDTLIAAHGLAQADVVGFTTMFSQTVASIAMARRLKAMNPGLVTAVGGSACHGVMGHELARQVEPIDYVFSGSGLVSFPAFVQRCMEGDRAACDRLNGVFSKTNQALWQAEPPSCQAAAPSAAQHSVALTGDELDIDAAVPLDYAPFLDTFDRVFPGREVKPVLLFETSRGCSWAEKMACAFCGLNGLHLRYRFMTPANALASIRSLFKWAPRCPSFIAVDTVVPREYLKEVFPALGAPAEMKMLYEVRPDLTEAEIGVLCGAGVVSVQPGIEALSTSTLKLMRKGTSAFGNVRFLKACAKHPISLDWNLLIGSPGEPDSTCEKYLQDLPLLFHLAPPTGVYPIGFVRHSHYFEQAASYGLDLHPQDFYGMTFPFDARALANIAHLFVDRRGNAGRTDAWVAALNEQVARWRLRWLGADGKPQARLCFLEGTAAWVVYDSRSGEEREQEISPAAKRILDHLARPARAGDVIRALADLADGEAGRELAFLRQQGWLFEEEGRFLSLVVT